METLGLSLISSLINSPFTSPRIYSKKHFRHKLRTRLCICLSHFCEDLKAVRVKCKCLELQTPEAKEQSWRIWEGPWGAIQWVKCQCSQLLRAGPGLSSTPCSEQQLRQQKWGWQYPPHCRKPGETKLISRYLVLTRGPQSCKENKSLVVKNSKRDFQFFFSSGWKTFLLFPKMHICFENHV